MKPFKCFCVGLAVLTLSLSVGCKDNKKDTVEAPFFALRENMPAQVVTDAVVHNRVSLEFCDTLVASDSYGELITFIGGVESYKSTTEGSEDVLKNPLYGLCDLNGAVVVDAVFDNIIKHETDEGGYVYEMIKGTDGSVATAGERWVSASNGSWVFKLPKNRVVKSVGAERVVLERTRKSGKKVYKYLEFYTFTGKRKFTFETKMAEDSRYTYTIGKFSDGLAPVNIVLKTPDNVEEGQKQTYTEEKFAYYIDNSGKKIYENFLFCGEFYKGLAVVVNQDGLYGVMNTKGEWFLEPKFFDIDFNRSRELFACKTTGQYDVYDLNKNVVKTILCDRGFVDIIDSENFIYKKINIDTGRVEYFYADTGKPFHCKETGMFPDSESSVGGLYVCTYGGTGTIFDETGESIEALGDFGGLAGRFGNTAVVVNSDNKKVCFVSVSAKQRIEWMDYQYTNECLDNRYLVLTTNKKTDKKYCLYDTLTNAFLYEQSDYIGVSSFGNTELLSVSVGGKTTVYDTNLETILSIASVGQH